MVINRSSCPKEADMLNSSRNYAQRNHAAHSLLMAALWLGVMLIALNAWMIVFY